MQCIHTKENNIHIENIRANEVLRVLFNFKGFYYALHDGKVLVSDHPAKIQKRAGDIEIRRIPLSYNGWLVWKGMMASSLEDLSARR